ncbi:S8 family serine peptidase [Halobacteriaceae archaeon GCM10025711]
MPDEDSDDKPLRSRRAFLRWATATGLWAVAPATVSAVASAADRDRPDPVPASARGDPADGVSIRHPLDLPGVRHRLDRYRRTDDPTVLYRRALADHLRNHPSQTTFSVVVTTMGERSRTPSRGSNDRTFQGWRPTDDEVATLAEFGDVGFVASVNGTTVSLTGVSRADLRDVAALEFVLAVAWDPPLHQEGCGAGTGESVNALRSKQYHSFDALDGSYSIPQDVSLGVIGTGYDADDTPYTKPYAQEMGIDERLAKDFTTDGDWSTDTYTGDDCPAHGAGVADTVAYMLGDDAGHDNLFVPLKIWSAENEHEVATVADHLRAAIEYATLHGIDVVNVSSGMRYTDELTDYCTAQFCASLDAYARSGYVATSTAGNAGDEAGVQQPGGSWLTIGTGGVDRSGCEDGDADYHRHGHSCYASEYDYTTCDWCGTYDESGSAPTVYGAYDTTTDAATVISGTSFAAPVAAAAALVMQANDLYSYETARSIFEDMRQHTVCPSQASRTGGVVDAYEAFHRTKPEE